LAPPQLGWRIEYPDVTNVVEIIPPNIIEPEKTLTMRVRVLGANFRQPKANNGGGNNLDGVDSSNPSPKDELDPSGDYDDEKKSKNYYVLPFEVMWSLNGSSWERIFYGDEVTVSPTTVVLERSVIKGGKINFGSRGYRGTEWLPFYSTATATPNVVMMENGDNVPANIVAFQQEMVPSYLKPYLSADQRTVKIGPGDLMFLFEIGQTDTTLPDFDLQDVAVLVTFE
jgi:hypothetical protein